MNSSDLYKSACSYLGVRGEPDEGTLALVEECLEEAKRLARFRAVGKE